MSKGKQTDPRLQWITTQENLQELPDFGCKYENHHQNPPHAIFE
ncbi:MAG: hypothetical protein V7K76_02385 [Nostoc sp.]